MNATTQALLAFPIVLIAVGYSALKLMPKAWRIGVAGRAAAWVQKVGVSATNARRVEAKLTTGGACGSCDSCKACAAPAPHGMEPRASGFHGIPIRRL